MNIRLRPVTSADASALGAICFEAFSSLAVTHNFPSDFPAPEVAVGMMHMLIAHPGFYGVVAERDSEICGSNFLDERARIRGLGPITVDPGVQDSRIGRQLMQHLLDRMVQQGGAGVRLVQAAYHGRSLALYSKLGFEAREMLSNLQGPALMLEIPGQTVREAQPGDVDECCQLCFRVHGFERRRELEDAIQAGSATVAESADQISGYATDIGFSGHAVARGNDALKAPGFLLPTRNGEVLRWCLENGLQLVQQMTYMSLGLYNQPQGAYLPSILL